MLPCKSWGFLIRPIMCCAFLSQCVYVCVCIPVQRMAVIRGKWKEEGELERGNEIQKASTRCKWQSIYIPSAGSGAGGALKSGRGEGVPLEQVTPFALAAPLISPHICFISAGDQEASQCYRHNFGSHSINWVPFLFCSPASEVSECQNLNQKHKREIKFETILLFLKAYKFRLSPQNKLWSFRLPQNFAGTITCKQRSTGLCHYYRMCNLKHPWRQLGSKGSTHN